MKPTISLYHVSGLLPAQYRNDPASSGIALTSHAAKQSKGQLEPVITNRPECKSTLEQLQALNPKSPAQSVLPIHSFVRLIQPVEGLNLGGIYLIYLMDAKSNTYSFHPNKLPAIHRSLIEPVDIYLGQLLELIKRINWCNFDPGTYPVRKITIDEHECNIAITVGDNWHYITDGLLCLPSQESQGA